MIGFWLRCSAVFALTFALMMIAIRSQPRDDSAVRAFFTPPRGCAAPCLMGLRPGVTTRAQALAILKAHPWVDEITQDADNIGWTWNGDQPAFLQIGTAENEITLNFDFVESVYLLTATNTGAIELALGAPERWLSLEYGFLVSRSSRQPSFQYLEHALYERYSLDVGAAGTCPLALNAPWTLITDINFPIQDDHEDYTISTGATPRLPPDCN